MTAHAPATPHSLIGGLVSAWKAAGKPFHWLPAWCAGESQSQRRKIQQRYLEVLFERQSGDPPLSRDAIFDTVFPERPEDVIRGRDRPAACAWIDELVDAGVLVRQAGAGEGNGDCF